MSCLSILCIVVDHLRIILCDKVATVPLKLKPTGHNMGITDNFKSIIGSFGGTKRIG